MRTFVNIIWHFPFLGFLMALGYFISGIIFCCTIILIPVGLGYFQMAKFLLSPFTHGMVSKKELAQLRGETFSYTSGWQLFCTLSRIVYFIPSLFFALSAVVMMVVEFVSIIGIPCGVVYAKLFSSIFNPINKVCVPRAVALEIENRKNSATVAKYSGTNPAAPASSMPATATVSTAEAEMVANFDEDKLKSILAEKTLYSPAVVAACEREILARLSGKPQGEVVAPEPQVAQPQFDASAYGASASSSEYLKFEMVRNVEPMDTTNIVDRVISVAKEHKSPAYIYAGYIALFLTILLSSFLGSMGSKVFMFLGTALTVAGIVMTGMYQAKVGKPNIALPIYLLGAGLALQIIAQLLSSPFASQPILITTIAGLMVLFGVILLYINSEKQMMRYGVYGFIANFVVIMVFGVINMFTTRIFIEADMTWMIRLLSVLSALIACAINIFTWAMITTATYEKSAQTVTEATAAEE